MKILGASTYSEEELGVVENISVERKSLETREELRNSCEDVSLVGAGLVCL
jgi:hypothetical protein